MECNLTGYCVCLWCLLIICHLYFNRYLIKAFDTIYNSKPTSHARTQVHVHRNHTFDFVIKNIQFIFDFYSDDLHWLVGSEQWPVRKNKQNKCKQKNEQWHRSRK